MQRRSPEKFICLLATMLCLAGCAHIQPPTVVPAKAASPYLTLLLAREAENQGHWQEALELYRRIDDPHSQLARARIHFILNQGDAALALIETVLAEGSYTDAALELRTKIAARKRDWNRAIADASNLVQRHPEKTDLQLYLANFLLITSDFTGARTILERLAERHDDAIIRYTLARACLGQKDFIAARQTLIDLIERWPEFTPAYIDLAKTYAILGHKVAAEDTYESLLEIDPLSREGLSALVDLLLPQRRYDEARGYLQSLMAAHPDRQILTRLVLVELQTQRYHSVIELIEPVKDPSEELNYYLAIACAGICDYQRSLALLDRIRPASDEMACDLVLLKASVLQDAAREQAALDVLADAWRQATNRSACREIGHRLCMSLEEAGRRAEGLAVAREILKQDPHDPIALNFTGYVWADQGIRLAQAEAMIAEALKLKPDDGYILDSMAWVLYKRGRYEEALDCMRKTLELISDDPTINEHMGDILMALGKTQTALDYYLKAAVQMESVSPDLQRKIRELSP